jgi:hypothetical protein
MAYGALDPWDEQQDPFESSFFQQPQPQMSAPAPTPAAASTPPPSPQSMDPFTSSVFAPGAGAMQGMFAPGTGVDLARRSAPRGAQTGPDQPPRDFGLSSGSTPPPPSAPPRVGRVSGASGAVVGGGGFDYGALVDKVKASADPRERAVAQDQLARATYAQLKEAGHDVAWKDDQLVVDGRPYLVGDGASAPPREIVRDPNSTSGWLDRENALNPLPAAAPSEKTPTTSPYQNQAALVNAPGGRTQGGAQSPQEAYDQLAGSLDPNASREDMEAAIEQAFGHLPGYGGAYKESVMLNGRWYDMVTGYGGAGASWGGLTPKGPSKSAASSMFGNSFLNSPLSPMGGGGSGSVMGALAPKGARGVDLNLEGMNPALLALLQRPPDPPESDPMTPSYMGLLR